MCIYTYINIHVFSFICVYIHIYHMHYTLNHPDLTEKHLTEQQVRIHLNGRAARDRVRRSLPTGPFRSRCQSTAHSLRALQEPRFRAFQPAKTRMESTGDSSELEFGNRTNGAIIYTFLSLEVRGRACGCS